MLKNFLYKGYFFLPGNPSEELPGILKFEPGKRIELDLFGHFGMFGTPGSEDKKIVLGFTENGQKLTLLKCYQTSRAMGVPGFPTSKFSVTYLFIGEHYKSTPDIAFESCSVEYADFNHWLDISGFDKPVYQEELKEVTIKYKRPDKIAFQLKEGWNGEIEFNFSMPHSFYAPVHKAQIEQTPVLMIKPGKKEAFEEFHSVISNFNSFLALSYFVFPPIASITFYEPNVKEDDFDPDFIKVELFFNLGLNEEKYKEHTDSHYFLLLYNDINSRFSEVISKWYTLCDKIEAPINILTECFMSRGNPMELHFISLAQALENFHRRITGKDASLYQRLTEIIDNMPPKVKEALLGNETDFARRVTQNRNFYTHYSEKHEAHAASLVELFVISEKLKIILITCILQEIPFDIATIEKIITHRGLFLFNHLIRSPRPIENEHN